MKPELPFRTSQDLEHCKYSAISDSGRPVQSPSKRKSQQRPRDLSVRRTTLTKKAPSQCKANNAPSTLRSGVNARGFGTSNAGNRSNPSGGSLSRPSSTLRSVIPAQRNPSASTKLGTQPNPPGHPRPGPIQRGHAKGSQRPSTSTETKSRGNSIPTGTARQALRPLAGPPQARSRGDGRSHRASPPPGAARQSAQEKLVQHKPQSSPVISWFAAMETEYEELTGQLQAIRHAEIIPLPPVVQRLGAQIPEQVSHPQSVTRQILQPVGNQVLQDPANALPGKLAASALVVTQPQANELAAASDRSLAAHAQSLFDDPEFAELCDKGMNMQLQRTKNGATEKSRIAELAALVKLLRRCLKEMSAKSTAFVNAGLSFERSSQAQVEALKLGCDSRIREVEVEIAGLKRDAAQAAASHKQATASWQIQLDHQQVETSRAQREFERVTAERDKAREEARRVMDSLAVLEGNAKGMKKETGLQLRELQADVGETRRTMQDMQEAHARREEDLQAKISGLEVECETARRQNEQTSHCLFDVQQELHGCKQDLVKLKKVKEDLERDCARLSAGLSEQDRMNQEIAAQHDSSASEVVILKQRCTDLAQQLSDSQASLDESRQRASESDQRHVSEKTALADKLEAQQVEIQNLLREQQNVSQQNKQLSTYIDEANSDCRKLSADIMRLEESKATLADELQESRKRMGELNAEMVSVGEKLHNAEGELSETRQQLETAIEAKQAIIAESSAKAARLARLEGEFEAMQDAIGTGSVDQAEMLGRLISRVASLEAAVAESQCVRRGLHNQLVNLRGNVRVFCRLKPHPSPALLCLADGTSVKTEVDGKDQIFSFDRVFGAAATQQQVFDEVSELVQSALDGYQVCLFSYGQTGAGKTHTMQGGKAQELQGIIPRAVAKILEEAERLEGEGWEYELEASFVEVYNESLRDLLAEGRGRDVGKLPDANVIKHHPTGGPSTVVGAVRTKVRTAQDAAALVKKAASARVVEATAMNAVSSRSHSVFMLYICGHHPGSSTHLLGGLNLVDLAGSERLNRSQVEGQRQKEACSINKSLSALGDVFTALAARNPHVPYRNSKLTHLLQPCLGGDGKTLMFVNVNPEMESLQETVCSLRFATKVNACQTAARGGAKRHMSVNGDTRSSLQENKRQTLQGTAAGAKRKAGSAISQKTGRSRLK